MKISERQIECIAAPFIIAEMPGNHNQSLDHALAIFEAAEMFMLGHNVMH